MGRHKFIEYLLLNKGLVQPELLNEYFESPNLNVCMVKNILSTT